LTEITTLPSGLTVLTDSMPRLETAAVGLWFRTGSRHEVAAENGVAHLLEHMVFKGTRARSAKAIAEAIEDRGGDLNAYTSREMTAFHARVLAADVPLAVDLIADMLTEPRFDSDDLAKEREVVLQELSEARDTPDDIIHDHCQSAAYADQPLGRPVLGAEETLAALDAPALERWRTRCLTSRSAVLTGAGKVDHAELVALAEARLGALATAEPPAHEAARYTGGEHRDARKLEQAHVTLAYEAPSAHDDRAMAAHLFALVAGGGMSSRLFQAIREELGLVYAIWASHQPYSDTGLLTVYFGCAPKSAGKARARVEAVLAETAAGLEANELARAKALAKAGLLMGLEGPGGRTEYWARQQLVYGRPVDPAELVARIDALSLDDVRAAGAAMLGTPQTCATVGVR